MPRDYYEENDCSPRVISFQDLACPRPQVSCDAAHRLTKDIFGAQRTMPRLLTRDPVEIGQKRKLPTLVLPTRPEDTLHHVKTYGGSNTTLRCYTDLSPEADLRIQDVMPWPALDDMENPLWNRNWRARSSVRAGTAGGRRRMNAAPAYPNTAAAKHDAAREIAAVLRAAKTAGLIGGGGAPEPAALTDSITEVDARRLLNRALAAGPAAERALGTLNRLFAPGDVIELRALNPDNRTARSLHGRLGVQEERAALADFVRRHNGLWNIYVGVNPRAPRLVRATDAASAGDIVARRSVLLDLDIKDAPEGTRAGSKRSRHWRPWGQR